MNLRDYLQVVWRRRWTVLLVVAVGVGAVWFVGQPPPPSETTYSATATLVLKEGEDPSSILLYSYVAGETPRIVERVAADLGPDVYDIDELDTAESIEQLVWIDSVLEIGTVTIGAVGQPDAQTAEQVLDRFGAYMIEYGQERRTLERDEALDALEIRQQALEATIAQLTNEIERLQDAQPEDERLLGRPVDRVKETQLTADIGSLATVLAEADNARSLTEEELTPLSFVGRPTVTPEQEQVAPLGLVQRMIVGTLLAALLGVGLAFALHRFDNRLYNRRDTEAAFGLPVLAEVPKIPWRKRRKGELIAHSEPAATASESYRLLRSSVARARSMQLAQRGMSEPTEPSCVTLVTSASSSAGKTSTVGNLAVASVAAGNRVLIVAADLRRPRVHQLFDVPEGEGLTEAVKKLSIIGSQPDLDSFLVPTHIDGVTMLLHGGEVTNPGETLALAGPLLAEARQRFDVILVDTPPMLVGNDVNELMAFADLVLVVARTGRSTIDEGQWTEEAAERLQAPTCGVVLVGARSELVRRAAGSYGRRSLFSRVFGRRQKSRLKASSQPVMARTPGGVTSAPATAAALVPAAAQGQGATSQVAPAATMQVPATTQVPAAPQEFAPPVVTPTPVVAPAPMETWAPPAVVTEEPPSGPSAEVYRLATATAPVPAGLLPGSPAAPPAAEEATEPSVSNKKEVPSAPDISDVLDDDGVSVLDKPDANLESPTSSSAAVSDDSQKTTPDPDSDEQEPAGASAGDDLNMALELDFDLEDEDELGGNDVTGSSKSRRTGTTRSLSA